MVGFYASTFRRQRHCVFGCLSVCSSKAWNTLFPRVRWSIWPTMTVFGLSVRYNPMDLLHHLEKGKELSTLQYHTKSLQYHIKTLQEESAKKSNIPWIWRNTTDTNYPIWRRQERRSKYAVQLASWQLRSNSPKTSVWVFPGEDMHRGGTDYGDCNYRARTTPLG